MMEIDDDQKEPGTIVQEIQKGFMMKDRLLRPALVGVSKKTKVQDEEKSEENKEEFRQLIIIVRTCRLKINTYMKE